ncbi:MAG: hypothetical protein IH991_23680 [Planctomycetes bacterium]|nr:hypothetical protein [Planctomycetota bacterium]
MADPAGPPEGSSRVLRGGAWDDDAEYCRAALRGWFTPTYRVYVCGFRVLCVVE